MKHGLMLAILILSGSALSADGDRFAIRGEYVEARTCAVWTGSCFANGEVNLMGKNAVVGWSVTEGSWDGVKLDGLKIAAVLNAEGTLHTKYEGKVTSVVYVDKKATCEQRKALTSMARALAPDHMAHVTKMVRTEISFARKGIEATLTADKEFQVKTEAICHCDSTSCHAYLFYPAVSKATEVESAKAVANAYQGEALGGIRWSDPDRQSAMVGTFAK